MIDVWPWIALAASMVCSAVALVAARHEQLWGGDSFRFDVLRGIAMAGLSVGGVVAASLADLLDVHELPFAFWTAWLSAWAFVALIRWKQSDDHPFARPEEPAPIAGYTVITKLVEVQQAFVRDELRAHEQREEIELSELRAQGQQVAVQLAHVLEQLGTLTAHRHR